MNIFWFVFDGNQVFHRTWRLRIWMRTKFSRRKRNIWRAVESLALDDYQCKAWGAHSFRVWPQIRVRYVEQNLMSYNRINSILNYRWLYDRLQVYNFCLKERKNSFNFWGIKFKWKTKKRFLQLKQIDQIIWKYFSLIEVFCKSNDVCIHSIQSKQIT